MNSGYIIIFAPNVNHRAQCALIMSMLPEVTAQEYAR